MLVEEKCNIQAESASNQPENIPDIISPTDLPRDVAKKQNNYLTNYAVNKTELFAYSQVSGNKELRKYMLFYSQTFLQELIKRGFKVGIHFFFDNMGNIAYLRSIQDDVEELLPDFEHAYKMATINTGKSGQIAQNVKNKAIEQKVDEWSGKMMMSAVSSFLSSDESPFHYIKFTKDGISAISTIISVSHPDFVSFSIDQKIDLIRSIIFDLSVQGFLSAPIPGYDDRYAFFLKNNFSMIASRWIEFLQIAKKWNVNIGSSQFYVDKNRNSGYEYLIGINNNAVDIVNQLLSEFIFSAIDAKSDQSGFISTMKVHFIVQHILFKLVSNYKAADYFGDPRLTDEFVRKVYACPYDRSRNTSSQQNVDLSTFIESSVVHHDISEIRNSRDMDEIKKTRAYKAIQSYIITIVAKIAEDIREESESNNIRRS